MPNEDFLFERVLLTNDDGLDAPGLALLERIAATLAREVWVVAPSSDRSGTSHAVSFNAALRLAAHGPTRFAVDGTPGDCVVMGLRHLMRDHPPELVLSGINRGSNIGRETVFSGTVGAAMTGLLLGLPAIALSQSLKPGEPVPWETGAALAAPVLRTLAAPAALSRWAPSSCLNVNFPSCRPAEAGPLALTKQGLGRLHGFEVEEHGEAFRLRPVRSTADLEAGSEVEALAAGRVLVTPLRFERTDEESFSRLAGLF